jgi:Family of unknown function (DUF6328)
VTESPHGDEQVRPGETEDQRADRNFADILQELRVAQTGVQVLFGFLLTLPFQAHFDRLDAYGRALLVIAVLLLAVAIAFMVAPAAWHRLLFRHRLKRQIVDAGNLFAKVGLAALGLALVTVMLLVLGTLLPRAASVVIAAGMAVLLLALWVVAPLLRRRALTPELPARR